MLLTLSAIATLTVQQTEAGTIVVPIQYSTIQEAVDAATPGDPIQVLNGTYYESVNIDKSLNLVGESPAAQL